MLGCTLMTEPTLAPIMKEECDRQAVALRDYCESKFHVGQSSTGRYSVTGEEHIKLGCRGQDGFETPQEAHISAKSEFDKYTDGKTGTLYWRIYPEISGWLLPGRERRRVYAYYLRFLISDKPKVT
jgi:hypothetical protein